MSTIPTVEQFLAEQSSELDVEAEHTDPLESIAESLRLMSIAVAGMVTDGEPLTAELASTETGEEMIPKYIYDDLVEKHDVVLNLIHDVEAAIGKSTAKPSLAAKAVIDAWRNPTVEPEPEKGTPQCPACLRYFADSALLDGHACAAEAPVPVENATEMGLQQPAHDAPVEEWRAYCRALRPAEFLPTSLDTMNRSQIRTFLGIEQLAEA